MLPHREKLWLEIFMCECYCVGRVVGIMWLFDSSWNIDLILRSEGSNKISLRCMILKMAREKFWVFMFLSLNVRSLS